MKPTPGRCTAKDCSDWATVHLFHRATEQEILCDLHWDAERRALQEVFGDRWELTVEVRQLNSTPRAEVKRRGLRLVS